MFRNLNCRRLQLDESWSFVYAKARNVPTAKNAPQMALAMLGRGRQLRRYKARGGLMAYRPSDGGGRHGIPA
jgi:hypothetical protein